MGIKFRTAAVRSGTLGAVAVVIVCLLSVGVSRAATNPTWLPPTPPYWPLVVSQQTTPPQVITRGVTHSTETLQTVGGQQKAQILNVDLTDPNVVPSVVEAGNHIIDPSDETLTSMAARTGAVAGINGDFFAIQSEGDPTGMVIQNGKLLKSPNPDGNHADLLFLSNGSAVVTSETFAGTITDGAASTPLAAVNTLDPELPDGISLVTSDEGPVTFPASTVVTGQLAADGAGLVVDSISSNVTSLPQLQAGQEDLVANGTGASWLTANVSPGDTLTLSDTLAPYAQPQIENALSGGAILVQNGQMAVPPVGGGENNINDPVTGVGITPDGRHLIVAVFDGHQAEDSAEGLTRPQLAQWMIAHGAENAILFDSGGSSQMVGRLPGQPLSVLNTPSDGQERPVANGLFFSSAQSAPGAPVKAVANDNQPITMLAGSTIPVSGYATDSDGNPATQSPSLSVTPAGLATVSGAAPGPVSGSEQASLTAGSSAGTGTLVATVGGVSSSVPLRVVSSVGRLAISPTEPDLQNGATQQLTVTARAAGHTVTLAPGGVTWSVSPSALGSVSSTGLFTAASSGEGVATVTASAGGASVSTTIAVGTTSQLIDPMTDVSNWSVTGTEGTTASLSESTTEKAQPSDAGSMDVQYSIPAGYGDKQVVFSPNTPETFPAKTANEDPEAIGLWVKGQGTNAPGAPLSDGDLTLAESYAQVDGQAVTFYPTTVTYSGWRFIVAPLPPGTLFPLSVSFLDFLVVDPTTTMTGDLYVADLQALYPPQRTATHGYVPVPHNPAWLSYEPDPSAFSAGGATLAAIAGARISAPSPGATGATVLRELPTTWHALPSAAQPTDVQSLGDMSMTGSIADLRAAQSGLSALGVPYEAAVGPDESNPGPNPESNFTQVFGPTHQSEAVGDADVIELDDSQGGLLASDPFQSPAAEQYQWLVSQLDADSSPVTIVDMSLPAIDPSGILADQFSVPYEAQELEALLNRFSATHPSTHVVVLTGQGGGYGEQVLGPGGTPAGGGVPNFAVGDLGTPPVAAADAGGVLDYGLFHIDPSGQVQYTVEPVLRRLSVAPAAPHLRAGQHVQLHAGGTEPPVGGAPGIDVTLGAPFAQTWTSSAPGVVAVDPSTGAVHALGPGQATITVTSDGVSASATVTVTR